VITFTPSSRWKKEVIEEGRAKAPPKRPIPPQFLKKKQEAEEKKAKQAASEQTGTSS
jgi:hypothetical protein